MIKYSIHLAAILTTALGISSCDSDSPAPVEETYPVITAFIGTGEAGLGDLNLPLLETSLYLPQDLTFGPDGLLYVLDWNNHRVLRIANNKISVVIGTGELGDANDGLAHEIGLNHPTHVSFDFQGHLVLSAWHNSKVMRMDLSSGIIRAICGDGTRGFRGDGGPAHDAWVDLPSSTTFDREGRMYISDQASNRVRVVDQDNIIQTFVGTGRPGFSGDGGPAIEAQIASPGGQQAVPSSRIEFDSLGNLYLADTWNNRIRMVDTNGIIHTVAGNGEIGYSGEGIATEVSLYWPTDIALDSENNLYIADTFNSCIRKVDKEGKISTFAGICREIGSQGLDGPPSDAHLSRPFGIAFDSEDNLYIADTHNHRILVVMK